MVKVGTAVTLNMTDWQIQQLVLAIRRTTCRYVWLDVFSVPQEDQDRSLKKRLLSRMMAVYGSAFATLVLISKEYEGDRYHQVSAAVPDAALSSRVDAQACTNTSHFLCAQRMWTLQEFCASKQLLIAREANSAGSYRGGITRDQERLDAETQRKKHMQEQQLIMPVWLGDSVEKRCLFHFIGRCTADMEGPTESCQPNATACISLTVSGRCESLPFWLNPALHPSW